MLPSRRSLRILLGAFSLAGACASSPPPQPQPPARIKDTVPERVAAQRAAQKDLNLEGEDERWGIEAARERKERARTDSRTGAPPPAPANAPGSSPADLRQTATPPPPSSGSSR